MGKSEPIKENADSQIANKKNAASQIIVKEKAINTLPLIFDENCKVLILGTFPGKDSRDKGFYYCDSRNYFWDILEEVYKNIGCSNNKVPIQIYERRKYLLDHKIALWDICSCCYVDGSKDKTIEVVETNPVMWLLDVLKEKGKDVENDLIIYCNGQKALNKYNEYIKPKTQKEALYLPSSSGSNNGWNKKAMKNSKNYPKWENALK